MLKVLTALAAVLVLQQSAFAGSLEDLDAKYGFREYKFNTEATKHLLSKKTEQYHEPKLDCYVLHNITIGSIPVKLTLFYYKKKLMLISLETDKDPNETLLGVLKTAYGDPNNSEEISHEHTWISERVGLTYAFNIFSKETKINFGEIKMIADKQKEDQIELDKASREDL